MSERGLYRIIVRKRGRSYHAHVVVPAREASGGLNSNPYELTFVGWDAPGWYARKPARAAAKAVRAIGTHVERVEVDYSAVVRAKCAEAGA